MGVGLGWEHDRVWLHVPSQTIFFFFFFFFFFSIIICANAKDT